MGGTWAAGCWAAGREPSPQRLMLSPSAGVPCTENDYKLWSPSDERGSQCLLGHKTVFKRRTPHATCFNGEDFDRPVVVANCSCTRADYEWWVPVLPGRAVPSSPWGVRTLAWPLSLRKGRNHEKQIVVKHLSCATAGHCVHSSPHSASVTCGVGEAFPPGSCSLIQQRALGLFPCGHPTWHALRSMVGSSLFLGALL